MEIEENLFLLFYCRNFNIFLSSFRLCQKQQWQQAIAAMFFGCKCVGGEINK
jgi:hypothetical protein